ncbi:hypothetical protein DCC81_08490 [Chitinophaga parva]|uniref:Uncharacterized protein n=1 Tax=Chitinophaga parva TaxID=2169414 RepID=A0A2T7BP78_9BACT|nr:hypothetical protein [Chitinophaga parva]PUZ29472.1 hypothetical protein DCC81_08490 [Chitinophaga parva]
MQKFKRLAHNWKAGNRGAAGKVPLKVEGLDFLTGRFPAGGCPAPLQPLTQRTARTYCVVDKGSVIMQSTYNLQGLEVGHLVIYNDDGLKFAPRMSEYYMAVVYCLKGGADCQIVGEPVLKLQEGHFQLLLLRNDAHLYLFEDRLSVFYYLLLPVRALAALEGRSQFRNSPLLHALRKYGRRHETIVYDKPQQVVTDRIGTLISEMQHLPGNSRQLRQALFGKAVELLWRSFWLVGLGNNSEEQVATTMFRELFARAEEEYAAELDEWKRAVVADTEQRERL